MKHEDVKLDKKVVKKAVGMHDKQQHGGKKTNLATLKSGGMCGTKAKTKKYEDGGEVEFESKTGSNKNIDDDARIRAMDMINTDVDKEPRLDNVPFPKSKSAPKAAAKAPSKFSTSDTKGGAAITFRKQSAPKAASKPAAKKDNYTPDHSMGVAMKRGGSVRGCGIAKKGFTKGKIV